VAFYCVECDDSGRFRWNGKEFEAGLFVESERVLVVEKGSAKLRSAPAANAAVVGEVAANSYVTVLEIVAQRLDGRRWYKVQVIDGQKKKGQTCYLSQDSLSFDCCTN